MLFVARCCNLVVPVWYSVSMLVCPVSVGGAGLLVSVAYWCCDVRYGLLFVDSSALCVCRVRFAICLGLVIVACC